MITTLGVEATMVYQIYIVTVQAFPDAMAIGA